MLAAPGGASQIVFGDAEPSKVGQASMHMPLATGCSGILACQLSGLSQPIEGSRMAFGVFHSQPAANNNYARPAGQNVGNMLTNKPSSKVLAPVSRAFQRAICVGASR